MRTSRSVRIQAQLSGTSVRTRRVDRWSVVDPEVIRYSKDDAWTVWGRPGPSRRSSRSATAAAGSRLNFLESFEAAGSSVYSGVKGMSIAAPAGESQVPTAASSSWRTWLMTGTRRGPIYRRRVRGAHKGLKRMLVEGMGEHGDPHGSWRGFSGAMVRQAVGEAVSSLPPRERQLIKLAYFSDLSNREIAQGLGITLSSVERGLRQAIARVSEQVERGRVAGRRAIYALAMFLGGRWLNEAHS